jgi:hypothetical protein
MSWPAGRSEPYTEIGIRRMKCIRCGSPSRFSWAICADGNVHRPLCVSCDVSLNRMVLEWAGDPDVEKKMTAYEKRVF